MNLIKTILILVGIVTLLVGGFCAFQAFSGRMDVSATGEHGTLSARLLQGTREAAVRRASREEATQLPDLNDQDILFEAIVGYQGMCAACHTPPGGSPTAMSRGLNPPATDLAWAGANRSPEELFWVTKHGIRMTAMPAWGPTHSDAELWPIVALITRFPDFAEADYGNLLEAAQEAGVEHHHHHDDHDHGHEHEHEHQHHHDHEDDDHHSDGHSTSRMSTTLSVSPR
ncbi:MAG: cytochrome c [Wenzhouxiangella sp.]|nr:cytochrome c [Wenzhouxiangella sp.]